MGWTYGHTVNNICVYSQHTIVLKKTMQLLKLTKVLSFAVTISNISAVYRWGGQAGHKRGLREKRRRKN